MSVEKNVLRAIEHARATWPNRAIRAVRTSLLGADGVVLHQRVAINTRGDIGGSLSSNPILLGLRSWMNVIDDGKIGTLVRQVVLDIDYHDDGPACPFDLSEADDGFERERRAAAKAEEPRSFSLVAAKGAAREAWMERVGDAWQTAGGATRPVDGGDDVKLTVEAVSWDALFKLPAVRAANKELALKHLVAPGEKQGWVDPGGKWYPCRYHDHDALLDHLFGLTEPEAMAKGYIRVHADNWHIADGRDPSQRQIDALFDIGFVDGSRWRG
jgi:hypothetical protein